MNAYDGLNLTGKVALVTGGSRGIGQATVELLRARGATVYDASIDVDDGPTTVRADVSSASDCARVASIIEKNHNVLHILVNNAGIAAFDMGIEQASEADWDRTMGVNVKAAFLLSKALLPALRRAAGACIVNVSSVHALATAERVAPYAASKGSLAALTRSMAIDLAEDRIRVVSVLPGATSTPMLEEYAAKTGGVVGGPGFSLAPDQIGRVSAASEVAEGIVFVASPAASAITGSALTVDGGMLARFA